MPLGIGTVKNSPQMLYKYLADLKENNPLDASIKLNTLGTYRAPVTTGGCN